mgnify:CR=1 FL=1|jgi:hypothetical protein
MNEAALFSRPWCRAAALVKAKLHPPDFAIFPGRRVAPIEALAGQLRIERPELG